MQGAAMAACSSRLLDRFLGYVPLSCLLVSVAAFVPLAAAAALHSCVGSQAIKELLSSDWTLPFRLLTALWLVLSFVAFWVADLVALVLSVVAQMLGLERRVNFWVMVVALLPFLAELLEWW